MMQRLRELRIAKGFSQSRLAKEVGTTQQSVARWEAGTASPSLKTLDTLAYVLQTTIAYLLGQSKTRDISSSTGTEDDVFWGHIGLLLPKETLTKWYPIGEETYRRLWTKLRNLDVEDKEEGWILCECLNNRFLAFAPEGMQRVWLLDDDCDGPTGDFLPTFCQSEYSGLDPAIYKALDSWVHSSWGIKSEDEDNTASKNAIEEFIAENGFEDEDVLHHFLHDSHVYLHSGKRYSTIVEPKDLWHALVDLEHGFKRSIYLPGSNGDHESFFFKKSVVLIDASMIDALEGQDAELREYEDEANVPLQT